MINYTLDEQLHNKINDNQLNDAIDYLFDDDLSKNNNDTLRFSTKSNFLLNITSHYSTEACDEKNYHIMKINKIYNDRSNDQMNDQSNDQKIDDHLIDRLNDQMNDQSNDQKKIDDHLMKIKYDYFNEKCMMNSIIVNEELRKIIRRKIIELNKIELATYYLFCLTIYESLNEAEEISNYRFTISEVTIQRCCNMLFKGRFKNEDSETQMIKETYLKYEKLFTSLNLPNVKSLNQPIEKFSVQIFTNLKNHYQMNFFKFQNRYLKSKLTIHLHTFMNIELDKKITKSLINYLTKCCQSAMINNKKFSLKLDP